jgi:STE24 endopeptidase
MHASSTLTLLFTAALIASLLVKFWLTTRQVRHVAAHRDAVPAAFRQTVALSAHQRAADYTLAKSRFGLLVTAFGAAVLIGWTLLGGLDALNVLIRDAIQPRWGDLAYQLALLTAFVLIGSLLELPFELYGTFRIEQRFGFNRMTWRLYLLDLVKGVLVGAAIGLPIGALMLWIMGSAGHWWWLWAWGAWMAFNLAALVLYPTVIAPLFNKFTPLADDSLKQRIEGLMARVGFASKGLFVMDGSKRSAHGNAYFSGFGANKRIVFFDTLLERLAPAEIEAVLAHELGHFKLKHIVKRIVVAFALSLVFLALLGWLKNQVWFYTGLGVLPLLGQNNDAMALLLFMLVLPVFTFPFAPLTSIGSRKHEFEADAFAASHSNARDLVSALVKMYEDNASTLTPDPLHSAFYDSHPPASIRIHRLIEAGTLAGHGTGAAGMEPA